MRSKTRATLLVTVAITLGCTDDGTVRVHPEQTFQTMRAWEATAWAGNLDRTPPSVRNEILDSAAALGITRLRVPVKAGSEQPVDHWRRWRAGEIDYDGWRCVRYATVNDNDDPDVIDWDGFNFSELDNVVETVVLPFRERLERRGEQARFNLNYVAFTDQLCGGEYIHVDHLDEYAEFVLAAHVHLRDKYGLVPDSWEMILEPDNTDEWTPAKLAEAMEIVGPVLEAHGFNARFVAPSTVSMRGGLDWVRAIVDRPDARRYLWEISYHRYHAATSEAARQYGALATEVAPTAMLEWMPADHNALYTDLAVAQVSSWQQFALGDFGDDEEGKYFLIEEPTAGEFVVRPGSRTSYLRPFIRNVRPGAIRIGAEVVNGNHRAVAFTNPDGGRVVGVWHRRSGSVVLEGLEPGEYQVIRVNADGTREETSVLGGRAEFAVEGSGIMVVAERRSGPAPD
jgi:hypothetical protein